MWVQNRLKDYPIPMTNFSTCWNDGLAFCALIHVFYPDNFDWSALDAQNRRHNFTLGFDKAEYVLYLQFWASFINHISSNVFSGSLPESTLSLRWMTW